MLNINKLSTIINDLKILNNISLKVPHGKVAVLLGASGVGKSTLLRVLNNLEPLTSGTIELDDKSLDLKTVNRTHLVGMVFQHFNLFDHLTVKENITLALKTLLGKSKKEADTVATKLLRHYGLNDLSDRYPIQLSGGQKQRLAIARTIALKPKVICFDEPTSALDPMLTTSVANNIKELASEGYIILVASHDTTLLEKLDCMIHLMQKGTIVESANSEEFWVHKEHYPQINSFIMGTI